MTNSKTPDALVRALEAVEHWNKSVLSFNKVTGGVTQSSIDAMGHHLFPHLDAITLALSTHTDAHKPDEKDAEIKRLRDALEHIERGTVYSPTEGLGLYSQKKMMEIAREALANTKE